MKQISYTIVDPDGIHARPAGLLVQCMQSFPCAITVEKAEKTADGKRLFSVMKLGVKKGDTVKISADGEQEDEAIEAITAKISEIGL